MSDITNEEIKHLGTLSRIKLTETEVDKLSQEIPDILDYVGAINEVVPEGKLEKKVGAVFNVFREDEVTNEPGAHTEDLLAEMPERDGQYMKVKKILN